MASVILRGLGNMWGPGFSPQSALRFPLYFFPPALPFAPPQSGGVAAQIRRAAGTHVNSVFCGKTMDKPTQLSTPKKRFHFDK